MCEFATILPEMKSYERKVNEMIVELKIRLEIDAEFVGEIINRWKCFELVGRVEVFSGKNMKGLIKIWEMFDVINQLGFVGECL
jgi:hypothetical protein